MASPGFVVNGKGHPESLNSASHGDGRVMSRTQASTTFQWKKVNAFLRIGEINSQPWLAEIIGSDSNHS